MNNHVLLARRFARRWASSSPPRLFKLDSLLCFLNNVPHQNCNAQRPDPPGALAINALDSLLPLQVTPVAGFVETFPNSDNRAILPRAASEASRVSFGDYC